MMITSSGTICDVCDYHIFWDEGQEFKVNGIENMLHCHTKDCLQILKSAGEDWEKLPKGRLRKVFEAATGNSRSKT